MILWKGTLGDLPSEFNLCIWETKVNFLKVESHDPRQNENKDSDIENEESNHGGEVFDDPNEVTKTKVSILGVVAL